MKNTGVHIILSGGKASRFGMLTKGVSKSLVPLGNTTLLHRQVGQSIQSGNSSIIICTNRMYFHQIGNAFASRSQVRIVYETNDIRGPLWTLNNVLKTLPASAQILMTLGDIYFLENPFDLLKKEPIKKAVVLAGAEAFDTVDLSLGGVVFSEKGEVHGVVKEPLRDNSRGYKWSGTALFTAGIQKNLENFLQMAQKSELEDFFEFHRLRGNRTVFVRTPDFINVNRTEDFHLAMLYNMAETYGSVEGKAFSATADRLRRKLLRNT